MKIIKWILDFLKKIVLFIVKEFFSFFIKLFLFLTIVIILFSVFNKKDEINKNKKTNIYVSIDLSQDFKEKATQENIIDEKKLNFYSLINNLKDMQLNENVKGVLFKLDNLALDYAQIEELSKELKNIKMNKNFEIIAYMEEANRKNLYLASFADKIYMPKTHSTVVNIYPYFKESFYKKKFLEKLGVKVNIVNTGNYKSYGEDFASDEMSSEAREDATRILNENYQNFLDVVSENFNYSRNKLDEIIKNGELVAASSQDLFEKKLISDYMYWDELLRKIDREKIINLIEYEKDYKIANSIPSSSNKIYIVALEGEIIQSDEEIFNGMFIASQPIINTLDRLEKDESVKGLILRINSPGGSALTSDKINNRIKEFVKKKPVYVSMGGVAASGGYYIASNATKIFADENTITGSIGVVSMIPNFSDLLNKAGVKSQKITEGKFADLYSSDAMTEEKYNKILNSNLKVYDDFLNEVSSGRRIPREKLEKIAEGRIWTGREAVQIGLVDKVGSLSDTFFDMVNDLGLGENYTAIFLEDEFDLKNIYKKYSKYLKTDKMELIKKEIYNDNLYNKPIMYMPYEIYE
ncbi:MAG: signal peptide peptidase SppA [Fusobacterium gastrosuis]|uniref:signal peptide peptidase SppA n=1 Tax=Fusobacterium gastrosuis TaxID=1755100 RepID=UPI002A964E58|nr:signal peptide peptidase SppA [Fusobacteriaceae bacterium]MDY5795777.1 signal peptide peptidase SppA [Fusobacterium gastrosuis]